MLPYASFCTKKGIIRQNINHFSKGFQVKFLHFVTPAICWDAHSGIPCRDVEGGAKSPNFRVNKRLASPPPVPTTTTDGRVRFISLCGRQQHKFSTTHFIARKICWATGRHDGRDPSAGIQKSILTVRVVTRESMLSRESPNN
eukprot:scaffold37899_cov60-Attheya_sp.AAC.1